MDTIVRMDVFIGIRMTEIVMGDDIAVIIVHIIILVRGRDVFLIRTKTSSYIFAIPNSG